MNKSRRMFFPLFFLLSINANADNINLIEKIKETESNIASYFNIMSSLKKEFESNSLSEEKRDFFRKKLTSIALKIDEEYMENEISNNKKNLKFMGVDKEKKQIENRKILDDIEKNIFNKKESIYNNPDSLCYSTTKFCFSESTLILSLSEYPEDNWRYCFNTLNTRGYRYTSILNKCFRKEVAFKYIKNAFEEQIGNVIVIFEINIGSGITNFKNITNTNINIKIRRIKEDVINAIIKDTSIEYINYENIFIGFILSNSKIPILERRNGTIRNTYIYNKYFIYNILEEKTYESYYEKIETMSSYNNNNIKMKIYDIYKSIDNTKKVTP